ncbi:MAG: PAS domain S-box protein, partial [Candidatus Heimdallarchaeota archaeon]
LLELVASVGFNDNKEHHSSSISIDDYSYITADVARHKRPLFAPNLTESEYMRLRTTPFRIENIQAFISWPILNSKQELIGTLQLVSRLVKNFSPEDRIFFETIVDMFASSLERKLSDEALSESERAKRILANIVERSKEVVIQVDEKGIIFYASSPVKEVFGYSPIELIGKSFSKLVPPGGEVKQKKIFEAIKKSGSTTFESIRQHKDGALIPVIMTVTPETDEKTGKTITNAVIVDISEVKRLEASLRDRSYELEVLNKIISAGYLARSLDELLDFTLNAILNSLDFNGGAIYFIDEDGGTATIRRSLGMSTIYIKTAEKIKITSPAIKKLFMDGKSIIVPDYMTKSEGHVDLGIATLIGVPFFSKQKVIGGLFLSTKEKRAISKDDLATLEAIGREIGTSFAKMVVEEEYQNSEKNLLSVLTSIGDLVLIIDAETGKILRVNKKAQQKLAYTIRALRKMTIQELIPDNKLMAFNDVIEKTLKSGKAKYQLTMKTKTQKEIEAEMHFYKTKFSNKDAVLLLNLKS